MAEFCVLPDFRARGLGAQAARALFAAHPGAWRIGIMANNAGALRFWRTVAPQAAVQPPREADGEDGFWMLSCPARLRPARPTRPRRPGCAASPRGDAGGHASHPRGRRPGPGGSRARQADHAGHRTGTMPGRGRRRPHRGLCDAGPRLFGHGFVSLIVVAAACRRQGVALRLLQAAVTACDTAKLSRRPTSPMSPPGA